MTTETPRTDGALARLARFCYRRRRLVLLTWIVGVIAVAFVGFNYGAAPDNDFSGGNSDSAKAQALIEKHFPERQGDTLTLAIKAEKGIDDPAARQKIEKVIADLDASPITGPIISPYQDKNLVTQDRRIARTTIPLTEKEVEKTEVKPLVDTVKDASGDGVTLGLGGDAGGEGRDTPAGSGRERGHPGGSGDLVHRLRVAGGDGPADRDRTAGDPRRHRPDEAGGVPGPRAGFHRDHRRDDRARRRHRLRTVHRDPLQGQPARTATSPRAPRSRPSPPRVTRCCSPARPS